MSGRYVKGAGTDAVESRIAVTVSLSVLCLHMLFLLLHRDSLSVAPIQASDANA